MAAALTAAMLGGVVTPQPAKATPVPASQLQGVVRDLSVTCEPDAQGAWMDRATDPADVGCVPLTTVER